MNHSDQKTIDQALEHVRTLHANMSSMWDCDTLSAFYHSVIAGTIARSGPEVAQALMTTLTEVYTSTAKSHVELGQLTKGLGSSRTPASPRHSKQPKKQTRNAVRWAIKFPEGIRGASGYGWSF